MTAATEAGTSETYQESMTMPFGQGCQVGLTGGFSRGQKTGGVMLPVHGSFRPDLRPAVREFPAICGSGAKAAIADGPGSRPSPPGYWRYGPDCPSAAGRNA